MSTFRKRILGWLYGLLAGIIGGIATAVLATLGGGVIGAVEFTLRQLGALALSSAIISAALYLKKSPLPPLEDDDASDRAKANPLGIGKDGFTS